MSVRTKLASKKEFRCAECGKGIVRPIAVGGRQANCISGALIGAQHFKGIR
jgi:hypothetical protein